MTTLSTQHVQDLAEMTSAFLEKFGEVAGDYYGNTEALQDELCEMGDLASGGKIADVRHKFIEAFNQVEQLVVGLEAELGGTARFTTEQKLRGD